MKIARQFGGGVSASARQGLNGAGFRRAATEGIGARVVGGLEEHRGLVGGQRSRSSQGSTESRPTKGTGGFTMIEIAIAIGVIGFALVAIIGILPAGMNVQKDTRENSIINQDAAYFMEAIRHGAPVSSFWTNKPSGYDFLTNYVEQINVAIVAGGGSNYTIQYPNPNLHPNANGMALLGLLSDPMYIYSGPYTIVPRTNYVSAVVRALNGSALVQGGSNQAVAFRYIMDVQITPFDSFAPDSTNFLAYPPGSGDAVLRTNRSLAQPYLNYQLYEARLRFSWPAIPVYQGNTTNYLRGPNHQQFRTMITGRLTNALPAQNVWFFEHDGYTTNTIL